jgi:beta-galactosidase
MRHIRVQNDAAADGEHAGCFGWCMFDYATHKDFGSGDRICYHGVMDAFRNPKLAAYAYASQAEGRPVLAVGSSMDIGDYPGGQIGDIHVFTNADSVSLYKNGNYVTTLADGDWKGLPHGPKVLEDTVGCLLETQEGFDRKKAELLRGCLLTIQKKGMANLSPADMAKMGYAMVKYGLKYEDAVKLYGKYIGNWGGESTQWRFDAIRDGKVVATRTCSPSAKLHLEVTPSHTLLTDGDTYDMAAVRIRILDEFGTAAPYAQLPLEMTLEGQAQLAGPRIVTAEGGMCGTYLRTVGKTGTAVLTVSAPGLEPVKVEFTIK